ncbi:MULTISPECIES: GFA family protein [Pseudoalteromonas]|uniref:Aldehyde-activating protein n=1 Tax=Pseudoalteromonas ruthenica TaxID=151081 RepID=A0A0F4Q2Q9_9GAMM|nr:MULTISPECIES: GFA family protein [Pseudoalteromonas]KJZ00857.1 aldehyde-activating protein [Pseudoalteromonas ruthenica]KJZ01090.1 aldehyde-activating protein [Pseudoalteromonas ruthenica]MCF2863151.1 GFA family protein [Pseudoalteromonas sp. CNAT2-18]MCG7559303.1 GFA family protein [Pseudoalteromonas sp. CNAT2-18.1]MCG7566938.1 GFA family protein [Pseudoalteromonas sp. CnMc7-15]
MQGSCLCAQVRFEIKGEFSHFYLCHCSHCRKDSGSAHGANLFSNSATLTWLSGEPLVRHYQLPHSAHCKSFCSRCGSALPMYQQQGDILVVPAGSLDDDPNINVTAHIFYADKARWEKGFEDIQRFSGAPKLQQSEE